MRLCLRPPHAFLLTFHLCGVGCQASPAGDLAQGQFLPLLFPTSHPQLPESYFPSLGVSLPQSRRGPWQWPGIGQSTRGKTSECYNLSMNPLVVSRKDNESPLSKKVASNAPLTLHKQPENTGEETSGLCEEQGCPEELSPGL